MLKLNQQVALLLSRKRNIFHTAGKPRPPDLSAADSRSGQSCDQLHYDVVCLCYGVCTAAVPVTSSADKDLISRSLIFIFIFS